MAENTSNDNFTPGPGAKAADPDAHGQAALLLVESLIHGLIEKSVISIKEAIDIVDIAADVTEDAGTEPSQSPATMTKSQGLLAAISASLVLDAPPD